MIEEKVTKLYEAAAEGWMGDFEAHGLELEILGAIAKLRMRIDELGGYHDDI